MLSLRTLILLAVLREIYMKVEIWRLWSWI